MPGLGYRWVVGLAGKDPQADHRHSIMETDNWFTEDFRLHEPGAPPSPTGHGGASQMRARLRALSPPIKLDIFDMIEEGNRVAVR